MDLLIGIILGALVGAGAAYFWISKRLQQAELDLELTKKELEGQISKAATLHSEKESATAEINRLSTNAQALQNQLAQSKAENQFLAQKQAELDQQIKDQKDQLVKEFEHLATRFLKQSGDELKDTHQKQLKELLHPFKENLSQFQKVIDDRFVKETEGRANIQAEIKKLVELNQSMTTEAKNLTSALKGDNKTQGNWGEFILERVLEVSGLQKGQEYHVQETDHNKDQNLVKPDVIVQLPEEKHLIIDSKVSLKHYESIVNLADEDGRTLLVKQLVKSVRDHVKGLSDKNYTTAKGWNTPDFVLMFMPVEAAFGLIMQEDPTLFQYAWKQKIVIVGPSTLLATLRTIANIWKHEKQHQNAAEIAAEAGNLYDKFVGFVEDLQRIKRALDQGHTAYDQAVNKLQYGRGNLVRRVEKLRDLGARNTKELPKNFTQQEDDA